MQARLTRSQVPVENTWNLSDLFASTEAWEAELAAVEADIPSVTAFQGRLGEGAATLLACLEAQERYHERLIRVFTYASLRSSEDGTDPANQAGSARVSALLAKIGAAFAFIESEIVALPEGTVEGYLAAQPGLADFRIALTDLLELRPHKLSPETEVALAALGEVTGSPAMIYNRAKSSDMQFEPFTDGQGRTLPNSFAVYESEYESAADPVLRTNATASFVKGLQGFKHTFAATFATEVKKNVALARLRKYPSTTHMFLRPQKVSVEVYRNVLDTIRTELAPHMQRYARLRRRVLGVETLRFRDLKAPLDPEFSPKTTYAEASEIILEALSILGPEYAKIMRTALRERWVDLADNIGKSTGAFCSSPYGVHPFILITWKDNMRAAFVLAHELGHAGHMLLAQRHQRIGNHRTTMFFIEAPSTMNELLLAEHILAGSNDARMRRWVISQLMGTYHHNFITHLLEGELQRRVYEHAEAGRPITANTLCEFKGAILREFWGDTVEIDQGAELTWMRQPHYYMGLYPYTYAAGLTVSTAAAQRLRAEGAPAVARWLEVLRAGGTRPPLELARMAGVDMADAGPVRQAVAYVGHLVDELEKTY